MNETGILNRDISGELAKMGHTDAMMVVDAGFAIPKDSVVIDLSLAENVPTTLQVLLELLRHFSVEKAVISEDTQAVSPSRDRAFHEALGDIEYAYVSQAELRHMAEEMKFIVRTGDFTANSNLVLVSAGGPRWYCERAL